MVRPSERDAVFADAAYYIALLSPRDQHHHDAVRVSGDLRRPIVVTEFVLIEVSNALSSVESRGRAAALWSYVRHDPSITLVPTSSELVAKGVDLYS